MITNITDRERQKDALIRTLESARDEMAKRIEALTADLAQPAPRPTIDEQIASVNAAFDAWGNGEDAELTLGLSAPAQQWFPIETAPSDVVVLLYTPNLHESNPERVEARVYHDSRAGSWHAWATHWMPLPAAPKDTP